MAAVLGGWEKRKRMGDLKEQDGTTHLWEAEHVRQVDRLSRGRGVATVRGERWS